MAVDRVDDAPQAMAQDMKLLWKTIQENNIPRSVRAYIVRSFKEIHPDKDPTPEEIRKGFLTLALGGELLPSGYLKPNILRKGGN